MPLCCVTRRCNPHPMTAAPTEGKVGIGALPEGGSPSNGRPVMDRKPVVRSEVRRRLHSAGSGRRDGHGKKEPWSRLGSTTSGEEPAQLCDREVECITFVVVKRGHALCDDLLKRLSMALLLCRFDESDKPFSNTVVVRHHLHPPDLSQAVSDPLKCELARRAPPGAPRSGFRRNYARCAVAFARAA